MLILNTPSSLAQHFHKIIEQEQIRIMSKDNKNNQKLVQPEEGVTMFSAVYNICVICIVETLKLLGSAIISKTAEFNNNNNRNKAIADRKVNVTPRRSSSKVVYVQSIKVDPAWLLTKQKQVQQAGRHPRLTATSSSSISSRTDSITTNSKKCLSSPSSISSLKMASRYQRVRHYTYPGCHRASSQLSHNSRRRSYPHTPNLDVITEEEEV
jgi:hypothetical protein